MDSFFELFENVKSVCHADPKVSEVGFNKWIKSLEAQKFENGVAVLAASNDFMRRTTEEAYSEEAYSETIKKLLNRCSGSLSRSSSSSAESLSRPNPPTASTKSRREWRI